MRPQIKSLPAGRQAGSDVSCKAEFDPTPSMHYVYVLRNKNIELYYGYTNNLERRIEEHNQHADWEIVYFEAYKSEIDARRREKRLKFYAQALKALKERLKESLK